MPDLPLSYRDFSGRLVLAGGRSSIPANALRRCVACAPEPEPQVKSRYGSVTRYAVPNVIGITSGFSSTNHILYDGSKLYLNTTQIDSGYNGNRLTFLKGPPATGLQDYLFGAGGGKLVKVSPTNQVSNWGIATPPNSTVAQTQDVYTTVIDPFDNSFSSGLWTATNCTLSDKTDAAFPSQDGSGSFEVDANVSGGLWRAVKAISPNLGFYFVNGVLVPSLDTDVISFYINVHNPNNLVWVAITVDVADGTFTKDFYQAVVQVVPQTTNPNAANAVQIISLAGDQWTQIAIAKSQFTFHGTKPNHDWQHVQAIRLSGGNPNGAALQVHFDQLTMYGGMPLGVGPASTLTTSNGSVLKYLVTFGNSTTGNDSNPNDTPAQVHQVKLNAVNLTDIPVSLDTQVTNRKLWRTSEGGELFFYLDTINDNSTTTYFDNTSSTGGPIISTPWRPAILTGINDFPGNPGTRYIVDGGNGYWFSGTFGTTGATIPNWNIPTTTWAALAAFNRIGDTIIIPNRLGVDSIVSSTAPNAFQVTQTGTTGQTQPNFRAVTVGNTITDGTVIWKNIGPLTTNDGTVVWSCRGINALPTLGNNQVLYDNAVFPSTIGDAVFFEGSVLATRDSAEPNYVYVSPPGRAEGYGNIVRVGSAGDPVQKLVVWNEQVWALTTQFIYPLIGAPPAMGVGDVVVGAEGTEWPSTVVNTPQGIIHRAPSGIRIFNGVTDELLGYVQISPIESGQRVENVNPFAPIIAEHVRNEVYFSDGLVTFAYHLVSATWRMLGLGANALYYNDKFDLVEFARAQSVVDYEVPGVFADDSIPISIEWQTASAQPDTTQVMLSKRIYLDCDLAGQILTPTLLVDGSDFVMPQITNTSRGTIEIPFQQHGRIMGVRLTGNVLARVILYGVWADGRMGQ